MTERRILVDTWAWLALYNQNDSQHAIAVPAYNELLDEAYILVTTNAVLTETYTNLRRWASHAIAVRFGRTIQAVSETGALEIVRLTEDDEKEAWTIFEMYDTVKDLSFTDCTSFAAMRRLGLTEVFTADKHFAMLGFVAHP